ncbi:MAG: hypothetical protein K6E95_06430 [Lachnospiraceae bacterium]|nr:hypothetical protein [Lachnospiraceae bacterium]
MRVNEFGTFGICVDVHSDDKFEGRMFVSIYEEARPFKSLHGLICEMNKALEAVGIPHPFQEYRSFSENKAVHAPAEGKENTAKKLYDHGRYSGRIATFLVNILYRQNATWQGSVKWVENDKTMNFRSALELFVLIESIL